MELVKAVKISLNNGTKDILIEGDFRLLEGEKYGLIGPNGVGKTTLIRMILGVIEPDKGSLALKKNLRTGYVPQQPDYDREESIEEFLLSGLAPVKEKMTRCETAMASPDPLIMEEALKGYPALCEEFEAAGGYDARERGINLIQRLGLDNPPDQKMGTLSGGERSMVFFARALLSHPELLILDEPGNHLDYLGLAWLEQFIAGYPGAVLIVSHNRYLLDKTCDHLLDMFAGKLTPFTGSYSSYRLEKYRSAIIQQSEYEADRKERDQLEKKIRQLQSIATSQYNPPATVMKQLGAAKSKLERLKAKGLERPQIEGQGIRVDFGEENTQSRIALQIKDFSLSYGDNILFEGAEMEIHSREKVALVGPNGSGKSSLLGALMREGDWDGDTLRIGPSQIIGYLSQVPSFSEGALTIREEVRSWGPISDEEAFKLTAPFSFAFEDMDKSLDVLSGGETNRLQLARLMYKKTNFLILDEPTNHMDIASREIIEEAVGQFAGTVLVVSHDRYFLDKLVDRVVEIREGRLFSFEGNFSEYFKSRYPVLPRLSGSIDTRGRERKESNRASGPAGGIPLEMRIQECEDEKGKWEKVLKRALAANDQKEGRRAAVKLEQLNSRLDKFYAEWEEQEN
jgi:ATP-binding cassette, subfamily F, member 3